MVLAAATIQENRDVHGNEMIRGIGYPKNDKQYLYCLVEEIGGV